MKISDVAAGGSFGGAMAVHGAEQIASVAQAPFYAEVWIFGLTGSEWSFAVFLATSVLVFLMKLDEFLIKLAGWVKGLSVWVGGYFNKDKD